MRKPRPTPDATFLFHPELDGQYVHFDGHEQAPFAPAATSMTRANAWWLAESALLSYWEPAEAISRFQTAGLTAEFVRDGDTQAYVASNAQVVLISFRGTEAGSVGDIVSDALVPLVPWTHGTVHLGFKAALERVWPAIVSTLEPLASSRSVWFSGHSLGGGLATLAADRFPSTSGVCTIGSPRVGDRQFAAAFNARFGLRALRYINDTDIVTHVPKPFPLPYKHVGAVRQITPDGNITSQRPTLAQLVGELFANLNHIAEMSDSVKSGAIRTAPDFLLDHMPRTYTVDIWNDLDAHRDD
jgi:triacylglycerol lipase